MNVLIAEDDIAMRRAVVQIFNSLGITDIVETDNGHDALTEFKAQRFGLVVTDWRMPSMNGLELVEHIRILNPSVPIIMCSVVDEIWRVMEALQSGVTEYVTKPCPLPEMREKFGRLCGAENG